MPTWYDKQVEKLKGTPEYEFQCALLEFEERLSRNIKPMPPEFSRTVDKLFWELLGKDEK